MKLNMGCGHNKTQGYTNVDLSPVCEPDEVVDLECLPWPWATNSVDEVVFNHCLEHLGKDSKLFLAMFKELYRICVDGAVIRIAVPHPRHDNFINDPTHVRVITPELLSLFSKKNNDLWKKMGASNTPLAHYLDVDFEVVQPYTITVEEPYRSQVQNGLMSHQDWEIALKERNNVASEYRIELVVRKAPDLAQEPTLSVAFLYEADWSNSDWQPVLRSYVEAFSAGEPVGLVLPLDSATPTSVATGWVTDVILGCGKEVIPDVVLIDPTENIIEILRRYGSSQWVPANNSNLGQLVGPYGLRLARILGKHRSS